LKDRLVTLGLALGALALFYLLFVPKPAPAESAPALPLSTEVRANGYQAIWRWLGASRVPVAALHERYGRLPVHGGWPPTGNVLLTTLPHQIPVKPDEATQLDLWLERGNTLIVMAALDDTPRWALAGDGRLIDALGRLTRLKFTVIDPEKPPPVVPPRAAAPTPPAGAAPPPPGRPLGSILKSLVQPENLIIEPLGAHPLLQGVRAVQVNSEFPASRWRASPMDRAGVLQIGEIAATGDPALWIRPQGRGRIIICAVAGIFDNESIGERDNARLLSNLIAWSREPGGAVIFDDAHQGAVSYYDAKAFFADARLHRTLAWIVLLWFVFVLGVQRLRAPFRTWIPVDVTAFVGSSGEFFAATLAPAAAGARLMDNFFNSIRRRLGAVEDGTAEWEWLSAQAVVRAGELAELRRMHDRLQAGRSIDLVRLQNLLVQLQGKIT
jgi:hypothetical protein